MSSNAYEILNSLVFCPDLLECGQKIIDFSNVAYKEKNRNTIVDHFYEQLYQWAFCHYMFNNRDIGEYIICKENNVVNMFLAIRMPKKKSAVKTIMEIKAFGEFIISNYRKPVGECISEKSLENVLTFLEKEYLYCSKIFSNNNAIFMIIHNTHKIYNSECTVGVKDNNISNYFFLYHMKEKKSISPETVLFHELGHAIHTKAFGDISIIPENIIDILHNIGFPKIKELNIENQREIFADVLSVGLMFKSPFSKYDIYNEIDPKVKELFNELALLLLENIKY